MKIATWEVHPAAVMLPPMSEAEFRELRASIQERGLLEPIDLLGGQVLDGCNRLRACLDLGVDPRFEERTAEEIGDPWEWVWARNVDRRHLEPGRRAALRLEFDQVVHSYREAALARQRAALDAARPVPLPQDDDGPVVATLPPREEGTPAPKTREVLAARAGVSPRTAQKALTVAQRAPELHRAVCAGELTLERAYRESRIEHPEWKEYEAFYTPLWVTRLLIDSEYLGARSVHLAVEPCVGDGAIVRAFGELVAEWFTCDIRDLEAAHDGAHFTRSWLDDDFPTDHGEIATAELVITNPAFSIAREVVERAWERCPDAEVWILQRRSWHDQARAEWFARHQPDEINLSPRVRFVWPDGTPVGDGTDNTIYTWYGFSPGRMQPCPGPHGGISRTLVRPPEG